MRSVSVFVDFLEGRIFHKEDNSLKQTVISCSYGVLFKQILLHFS